METVGGKGPAERPDAGQDRAASPEEHPLDRVIGGFADDPLWDDFIEKMERSRREIDRAHGLVA